MGIIGRSSRILRGWMNSLLNKAEDPNQQLDLAYEDLRDDP
jgi:hypothetical protein